MKIQDLKKYKLPDTPGVYFFLGSQSGRSRSDLREPKGRGKSDLAGRSLTSNILYIGKASSLRSRVKSYFSKDIGKTRGPVIVQMLERAKKVDFIKTDSVLEALILEASLIKKYSPKYNTKEKDDKSHNYIVITNEDFPRVLILRAKELLGGPTTKLLKLQAKYGPFPQGGALKDAMKIIRKIFPFRDKCKPFGGPTTKLGKSCFNRQIGLCPGVCSGEISKKEYTKIISNLKMFLNGKKTALVKKLEREMKTLAKNTEFEKAGKTKKIIFALKHIQDVSLIKENSQYGGHTSVFTKVGNRVPNSGNFWRIEGYDVAHISGQYMVGVMVVVENGEAEKSQYRKFKVKTVLGANDTASLSEVLERRFAHSEWQYPRLLVVDGGKAQKNITEKILKSFGVGIPVVSVVKDERHKPKNILGDKKIIEIYEKEILFTNAEAHRFAVSYHKSLRNKLFLK